LAPAIFDAIENPAIRSLPKIGAVDQFVASEPALTLAEKTRIVISDRPPEHGREMFPKVFGH